MGFTKQEMLYYITTINCSNYKLLKTGNGAHVDEGNWAPCCIQYVYVCIHQLLVVQNQSYTIAVVDIIHCISE